MPAVPHRQTLEQGGSEEGVERGRQGKVQKLGASSRRLKKFKRRMSKPPGGGVFAEGLEQGPGGCVGFEEQRGRRVTEAASQVVGLLDHGDGMAVGGEV